MSYMDFSSWPREQEQSFIVFEQRANESTKKAYTLGGIAGVIVLVFMVGIYAGVAPEHKDMTKGMNMDNISKKKKSAEEAPAPKAEAPKPAEPAPAAAPAADKPAEGGEKAAEPAAAEEKK
jgi:hypothetical protein